MWSIDPKSLLAIIWKFQKENNIDCDGGEASKNERNLPWTEQGTVQI